MSLILLSGLAADVWSFASAACATLFRQATRLIKAWRYRADIHRLEGMSDRQLRDIGLSRSGIEAAVRGETPTRARPAGNLRTACHS